MTYAKAIYKALRHEDPNFHTRDRDEVWLADNIVSIDNHLHVSGREQSIACWNEILATTGLLQEFLDRIEYHASIDHFSRTNTKQTDNVARSQNGNDFEWFLENVGHVIIDQYVLLIGVAVCKEGSKHLLRILFALAQSRGTDFCQRLVRKILEANADLDISHPEGTTRFHRASWRPLR